MLGFVNLFFIFLSLSTPAQHEIWRSMILRRRFVEHRRIQRERLNDFKQGTTKTFHCIRKHDTTKAKVPRYFCPRLFIKESLVCAYFSNVTKSFPFLIFLDPKQKQKLYNVDHTGAGDQQVLVDCEIYFHWEHGMLLWKLLLLVFIWRQRGVCAPK